MKKLVFLSLFLVANLWATPVPTPVAIPSSVIVSSASTGANGTVTATVPAPSGGGAYSTGYLNYITSVHIETVSSGISAGATKFTCTSTNLGNMAFNFVPAVSTGTIQVLDRQFANPIISTSTAVTTVTCPANAALQWYIDIGYFTAQ